MIYAIIIAYYCFPRKSGPPFNFSRRADELQRLSRRKNVPYSTTVDALINFNADQGETVSAIQIQRARGSTSTPLHVKNVHVSTSPGTMTNCSTGPREEMSAI